MKRYIKSATDDSEYTLSDKLKELSEDFDYITAALETLERKGYEDEAMSIATNAQASLSDYIDLVSRTIYEEE